MITNVDRDNYRKNVGIVICNRKRQVLWARRVSRNGWQFPQGGVDFNESTREAAFREMGEELGLSSEHVRLIGSTKDWLKYDIPNRYRRDRYQKSIRGQKQQWFLFEFLGEESDVSLDCSDNPEFDKWKWIDYWEAPRLIISFKRGVYQKALIELEPLLNEIKQLSKSARIRF